MQDEKRELQSTLNEIESGVGDGRIDAARIRKEIDRMDDKIEERTPGKLSGTQKDRMAKEEKDLEAHFRDTMLSRYEMRKPHENPGAVRKHMEWCKQNQARVERWVEIQRNLRPEEPRSIESFRREK